MQVRRPAVAGMFYPGSRTDLVEAVDGYLAEARSPELDGLGQVRAVIAPHAGYVYSGPTAGYAFKALQAGSPAGRTSVYLLGPAHRVWFNAVSTGDFGRFATPLGDALVDQERVRSLWALGTHFQALPGAHQGEHCLEVQLPFLQRSIGQFSLIPLLFGEVDACAVGQELAGRLEDEPDARVVVSSDLSHFEPYEKAQRMDRAFLQEVLAGNQRAVEANRQGACGRAPIVALMEIASQLGWTPHLLDYRNSGDTAGDKGRVVGYAAIAYTAGD
jgi:AmmeMemoRadiSam system protein B